MFETSSLPTVSTRTQSRNYRFYNGEVKDSIDTSDIQSELETRLLEYAAEKGFAVDDELKTI